MPTKLISEALYPDRFKARIGNPTENGTQPTTPEGSGDLWLDGNTLYYPNSDATAWISVDLSQVGSGQNHIFVGGLTVDHDLQQANATLDWNVELIDVNNLHDSSTNPDRIYFTGQNAGWYVVELLANLMYLPVDGLDPNTNVLTGRLELDVIGGTGTHAYQYFTASDYSDELGGTPQTLLLKFLVNITDPSTAYISLSTQVADLGDINGYVYLEKDETFIFVKPLV